MSNLNAKASIVIPCKNEEASISSVIDDLKSNCPDFEIIIVNDGSTDKTQEILDKIDDIKVITHRYSKGNGAAVKSGVRNATNSTVVMMDADGQHKAEDVLKLLNKYEEGFDMVVGSRTNESQASYARLAGNKLYNQFATYMTGHKILDLTSGFRVVDKEKFLQFIDMLPNGFSYPTTITMAFFKVGYDVTYVEISAKDRVGKSHISPIKDGIRFLLIIFKVGTMYSPLKIFSPISLGFFLLALSYYIYTYTTTSQFTNMGLLLFVTSVFIFIFGLISEQITTLTFLKNNKDNN